MSYIRIVAISEIEGVCLDSSNTVSCVGDYGPESSLVPRFLLKVDNHNQTPEILLVQSSKYPKVLIVSIVTKVVQQDLRASLGHRKLLA